MLAIFSRPQPGYGSLDIVVPARLPVRSRFFYLAAKRCFDIVAVVISAPLTLPLIGILAFLVRLDGGAAFFGQQRLGRNGETFTIWKLRSMVPDADRVLETYLRENPNAKSEWDRMQKLRNDPRVTSLGRYLRKYSADELPQLWNVFLGHMSLVGPRPMLPEQRAEYPGTSYFEIRPGLTGLWQVSDRNACSFAERAIHDTRYADIMSFGTDIWILSMTVLVVVRGTGV